MKNLLKNMSILAIALSVGACAGVDWTQTSYDSSHKTSNHRGFGDDVIASFGGLGGGASVRQQNGTSSQQNSSFSTQSQREQGSTMFDHRHNEQHNSSRSESTFSW
ncbi:2-nitropropane dioxygenase [Kingella kingae]|uniref:2-nitropropane dioxygenase n=1 Tax=Kingella kingae TaxID=504 RepID=UPI00254F6BDE|nr:2-nitropropane dioxygenase [Kingella kingae]MDK4650218.1 2-nitropropane dioxygenase [Kingella kingae]